MTVTCPPADISQVRHTSAPGSYCDMSMFDPLVSGFEDSTPPWPTTPHAPNQHIPNLRRASPAPPPMDNGPAPGLYGKEPQIYGQQEPGLVSPKDNVTSNGQKFEKPEPYLRIRITGMDRNRRDILVRLDAQVCNFPRVLWKPDTESERCFDRRISRISTGRRTETFHDPISSSSSFTRPSSAILHKR